jgi:hypothetical protein
VTKGETLRAEYDGLARDLVRCKQEHNSQAAVLDGYVSRIAQLEAALRKYGDHTVACASRRGHFKGPQYECDCGWIEQLTSGFKAEAALTPEQCRGVVTELESREWSGLTHDDIRMIGGIINDARKSAETPPHLRGPIIQAHADTNGVPPSTKEIPANHYRYRIYVMQCNCGWPRTTDGEHGEGCPANRGGKHE